MLFAMTLIIGLIEGIYLEIEEFCLISQKSFLRRTKQCLLVTTIIQLQAY